MIKSAGLKANDPGKVVPDVKVNPVTDPDANKLLPISEAEHVNLILESTAEHVVSAKFGIGWVALESVPSNRWAILRVAEMRGIKINLPKAD